MRARINQNILIIIIDGGDVSFTKNSPLLSKIIHNSSEPNCNVTFFHIKLYLKLRTERFISHSGIRSTPLTFTNTQRKLESDIFSKLNRLFIERRISLDNIMIANFIKLREFNTEEISQEINLLLPTELKSRFYDSFVYNPKLKNYLYKYNNNITGIDFNDISDQIRSITDIFPNTNIPNY